MAKRTKEQIQKDVKEASAKRKQEYFAAQTAAKEATQAILPDLPQADIYNYNWSWRQDVGAATGEYTLIKTPNGLYDPSTNEIVDPKTGARTKVKMSLWSGPTTFRAGTQDTKDPITGLTPAQMDAAKALAAAKGDAEKLAAQLGAKIDPKTGKIDKNTIDPVKAAAWYKTQVNIDGDKIVTDDSKKTIINRVINPNGTVTIFYSDGTSETIEADGVKTSTSTGDSGTQALIQSLQAQIASLTASQQQSKIDTAAAEAAAKKEKAENAIAVLTDRFNKYGLGSLVPKIRELAISGASEATITLQLQETEEYAKRFKANQARLNKGLQVLSPAEYLNLEDGYRQILRAYGLNQFDTDSYVNQFIENDVSAKELSDRVVTAVQRVRNADPAISRVLREFYGISDSDLVAYVLDPNQQFPKIQTQVAAAEIGAAAKLQGIEPGVAVAEQLARQGITQAEAQRGYATIANILPQAEKLSDIYGNVLEGYGLAEAEQEVFNTLASAQRKRQKLAEREAAAFAGSSGLGRTSLTGSTGGTF